MMKGFWLERLGSAMRTIIACTIIGWTTLYGPKPMNHFLAYPAFSYLTTILIVSDATLGDSLRGICFAFYATIQVMILSILTLWLIGPAKFNSGLAAVAVAATSFAVALPKSTPLLAKRIAFGQIVIVYVGTVNYGAGTGIVMHPLHVASSTALGAFAAVLAMLLPFPKLAYFQVRKASRLYVENASERLNLLIDAFTAQDNEAASDSISIAKFLATKGIKHLQKIKDAEGCIVWEKPKLGFLKSNCTEPRVVFQDQEMMIKGMEIALTSSHVFPVYLINEELREALMSMKGKISLNLKLAKCLVPFNATTVSERKEIIDKLLSATRNIATTHEELPAFFFLYCVQLLHGELAIVRHPESINTRNISCECIKDEEKGNLRRTWTGMILKLIWKRWTFAIKCSLSLGFAVLFGLIFNKENGYWSGLTIAISFVTGRQATFTLANARAQATAMGSVYGILCSFILQKNLDFRVVFLLPWIIFTSFLRHSRMYGQAGGISAVIGALLILGRKNYSSPSEFAIARITEACIGLICFVMVEILFQPARAATLAKTQLTCCLKALQYCIRDIVHFAGSKSMCTSVPPALRGKLKKLKFHISRMEKFFAEAALEPNFWFLPFQTSSYEKLLRSLQKMQDLLLYAADTVEILSELAEKLELNWKELGEHLKDDLDHFQAKAYTSLRCPQEVIYFKSLAVLENKWQKKTMTQDIESGKQQNRDASRNQGPDEDEVSKVVSSLLINSTQVVTRINASEGEQKHKSQMILCLSGFQFCISNLLKETTEVEKELKELLIMENPKMHIHLYEISSKITAMRTK
ncbi:uncharacterized protein LOC126674573 [Mercurialis annua]|uniref:uncharacterized protein LOC126674573 n=1 Tax=Mercurialis annua TaxID=3986 RepID=UPI002160882C|nr:uncharacterized protein LOC126674573 [Mercurialis annua]